MFANVEKMMKIKEAQKSSSVSNVKIQELLKEFGDEETEIEINDEGFYIILFNIQ